MTVTDSFHSIHSAIIARSLYFDYAQNIPNWRREIADISDEYETTLEPPVMEWLAAQAYRLLGGEQVWAPRLLAESFWFIGGIFLYLIGEALAGRVAALLSVAYYLFAPLGIRASTSFMPDPLMIMLFIVSLWAIIRYDQRSTWGRLRVAGITESFSPVLFSSKYR